MIILGILERFRGEADKLLVEVHIIDLYFECFTSLGLKI